MSSKLYLKYLNVVNLSSSFISNNFLYTKRLPVNTSKHDNRQMKIFNRFLIETPAHPEYRGSNGTELRHRNVIHGVVERGTHTAYRLVPGTQKICLKSHIRGGR